MRIGYVLKEFPRLSETFILTEIAALEAQGAEVTVLARYDATEAVPHEVLAGLRARVISLQPLLRERFWEAFEIHRRLAALRPAAHAASLDAALEPRNREEMRYWLQAGRVAEAAVEFELDLLHAHFATGSASVARYASRISGVPFTMTAHAKDIYATEVDRARLANLLAEAATTITVSEANLGFLRGLAPDALIRRIYNGVDLGRFRPRAREAAGASPRPPLVLSVGRFVEKKGLGDLLDALAILRSGGRTVGCRLVGSGPLEEGLRARRGELGLEDLVEFAGPASQEEVAGRHLREATIFVAPCVIAADGDRDGMPTTLLEAMASGVPVISTTLPGVDEAAPDGVAGRLVPPGDPGALARAIAGAIDQPDRTEALARAARGRVEELFDCRRSSRELLGAFVAATAGAAASGRQG